MPRWGGGDNENETVSKRDVPTLAKSKWNAPLLVSDVTVVSVMEQVL